MIPNVFHAEALEVVHALCMLRQKANLIFWALGRGNPHSGLPSRMWATRSWTKRLITMEPNLTENTYDESQWKLRGENGQQPWSRIQDWRYLVFVKMFVQLRQMVLQ